MQDFKNLLVWQKSHALTLAIYLVTRHFPKEEICALTSQLRRAAASVPANIAEECGRGSDPEFARFLQMAMGSAGELEYHLLSAHDLKYLDKESFNQLSSQDVEVKRMLASLSGRIKGGQRRLKAGS